MTAMQLACMMRRCQTLNNRMRKASETTMRVFLDTEFTDFIDCDLISIALVAEDGREFYGERNDFDRRTCSPFVHEAVLPQLGQYPDRVFSREGLRSALLEWLRPFESGIFCMDFPGDWDLLVDALDGVPNGWRGLLVGDQADQVRLESYYKQFRGRHHALHDARALRYAMQDETPSADPTKSSSD
ncbi:3'-5' exonuclease family protein [Burkholderia contaminans]|uniref:3'-5' exoribonuclease n=2 Tax=Burkholderia contaminans TaxID=488447 RepID=UPI001F20A68F|nr:3'-5' exoribonuclease [Burkholderia contaminans]MEB4633731.1 3'-5' exoribonuclease [Burkholderia contaminans]MEB4638576.1 3'-5' exoribonuclease [Burkholderia contaminans]MEB4657610.1 3'-5' exoribonuclease [Burkholderia contaminans]MEB4665588.1 3'-5' exoribonuclease [Burkholderia contaminans]MEB4671732.1 3'-5' exoribonuclease [Burkholderia contaminans]